MERQSQGGYSEDVTRVVVLGQGTVGKSSVTLRFAFNTFPEHHEPTIQDKHRKNLVIDGQLSQLEILDTAGQEEFEIMQDVWIKQGKGFVLVYAIDNSDSLYALEKIYTKIRKIRGEKTVIPIVLCANKIDLPYNLRTVMRDEGEQFAEKIQATYVETSAKLGQNCSEVFESLVQKIREIEKPKPQKVKKNFWDKCQLI